MADYEAADTAHNQTKKQEALQRILKGCESWLNSSSRKKLKPKDEQKRVLIVSLQKEALVEAAHAREETEFASTFKSSAYTSPEGNPGDREAAGKDRARNPQTK